MCRSYSRKLKLLSKRLKSRRSNAYLASSRTFTPPMYPIPRLWPRSRSSRWPGPFQLTVSAPGFETKLVSGIVNSGQAFIVPAIVLTVAATTTDVKVGLSEAEIAQEEVKEQEKQRVLGIFPNFYTTYVPDPAPLAPKQKFSLAWKSVTDPISVVGVGFLAGIYQASDELGGYGQGAAGYGRRFGALYGDVFFGTFIDSAILPSLLKQD